MQEIKFDYGDKLYIHKPESVLENDAHVIPWDDEIKTDHPIPGQKMLINKKKRIFHQMDFAIPADYWVKMKEREIDDNFDFLRELKKLWWYQWELTVIPVRVGLLGMICKNLENRLAELVIRGRIETIKFS